jgi:hypothetical protein
VPLFRGVKGGVDGLFIRPFIDVQVINYFLIRYTLCRPFCPFTYAHTWPPTLRRGLPLTAWGVNYRGLLFFRVMIIKSK